MPWITVIFICSILAIAVFGFQLALCLKANKKATKIILYIIIAVYAVALIMCLVDVLNGSGGVAIWQIFAYIISIANTIALVADGAAWMVYKHIRK